MWNNVSRDLLALELCPALDKQRVIDLNCGGVKLTVKIIEIVCFLCFSPVLLRYVSFRHSLLGNWWLASPSLSYLSGDRRIIFRTVSSQKQRAVSVLEDSPSVQLQ